MDKNKKIMLIGGIVEAAILIFALVLSILVWTTVNSADAVGSKEAAQQLNLEQNGAFIGSLQNNPTIFFCVVCIPVFVIVAVDLVYFAMIASKKETNLTDEQLAAIKKKAEEQVRAEMMEEILKEENNDKKE